MILFIFVVQLLQLCVCTQLQRETFLLRTDMGELRGSLSNLDGRIVETSRRTQALCRKARSLEDASARHDTEHAGMLEAQRRLEHRIDEARSATSTLSAHIGNRVDSLNSKVEHLEHHELAKLMDDVAKQKESLANCPSRSDMSSAIQKLNSLLDQRDEKASEQLRSAQQALSKRLDGLTSSLSSTDQKAKAKSTTDQQEQ